MTSVELPLKDLRQLFMFASLGKVIGGLIHNINGPLQNLSLNIEMTAYQIRDKSNFNEDSAKNILDRLNMMEEEFDRIDQLTRIASSKANTGDHIDRFQYLNDFLNQEISFMQNNLYFKHNVQTELNIQDNLPLIKNLPQDFLIGLSLFLQALVEDVEVCKVETSEINASFQESSISISFNTTDKPLSANVLNCLTVKMDQEKNEYKGDIDVGLWLSLIIFRKCNVSVESVSGSAGSIITLIVPIHDTPSLEL